MDIADIQRADDRREQGAWVTEGFRDLPGLALKVRGDGNSEQDRLAAEIWAAATPEQRKSPDFEADTTRRLLAETVLVDWNLKTPFSVAEATELLKLSTFRHAVVFASRAVAALGVDSLEADAGK